jgi:hypothetical protein
MNGIIDSNQKIVSNGLILNYDAAQLRSYPTTGTTWTDLSGVNNNGTLTNGPTFNSANGGSIVFDGVNDFVNLTSANFSSITNQISVFFWVYPQNLGVKDVMIIRKPFNGQGFLLSLLNRNISAGIKLNTSWYNNTDTGTSNQPIILDAYNYIGFTWSLNTMKLYFNGQLVKTSTITGTSIVLDAGNTYIGTDGFTPTFNDSLRGRISNGQIYNIALTETQALQNYNALKSRFEL